jgi:hypothetical protein
MRKGEEMHEREESCIIFCSGMRKIISLLLPAPSTAAPQRRYEPSSLSCFWID